MLLVVEGIRELRIFDHTSSEDNLKKQIIVCLKEVNNAKPGQEGPPFIFFNERSN